MFLTRFLPALGPRNADHRDVTHPQVRSSCAATPLQISLLLIILLTGTQTSLANMNKIQNENRKPGTTDWQLTNPADNRQIEGYASLTSVPVGGAIDLFVSTSDATYTFNIYRMGWYGGTGGRRVRGPITRPGILQVTPTTDPTIGLIECNWTHPVHVPIRSLLSGIYLVKLHGNTSGKESYIIFTVRDSRRADLVFQQSVLTYQAYNPWPGWDPALGYIGQSLYDFATKNDVQVDQVSFNRPYGLMEWTFGSQEILYSRQGSLIYGMGAGDFFHNIGPAAMDFGMVRWLEHEGYDVTYITDIDTHEDVNRLLRAKAYLSVGHDEYVSREMKANITLARDSKTSLGFFGANYVYWPVDLLPDSNGSPYRTISLVPANSCIDDDTQTLTHHPCSNDNDCVTYPPTNQHCGHKKCDYACQLDANGVSQTEQSLAGGMWDPGHAIESDDAVVTDDVPLDHWVFANTGLKVGDVIPGILGTEYNSFLPDYPTPDNLQILMHTQAPDFKGPGFHFPPDFDGKDFNGWYESFVNAGSVLDTTCDTGPIPPLNIPPAPGYCGNPFPEWPDRRVDWTMTVYETNAGAWVFNAATNQWAWGLDDYFTGLHTADGANNGPAYRIQCGTPWFHPGLVSCRNPAVEQITRNVLNRFIGH